MKRFQLLKSASNALTNIIILVVTSVVGLVILEYGLRLFSPLQFNHFEFVYDPHPGFWHKPNMPGMTNNFGMQDSKPRQIERKPGVLRVAILGDSYMEWKALIGNRMSDLMESYSDGRLEVLNFGISSVGTVQELDIYRHHIRQFQPDVVICALLTVNDVRNNNYELEMSSGYQFLRYATRAKLDKNGEVVLVNAPLPGWKDQLRVKVYDIFPATYNHLAYTARLVIPLIAPLVDRTQASTQGGGQTKSGLNQQELSVTYGVYSPPEPGSGWEEAWQITEWAILQLQAEVEADGADFVLVILSDAIQLFEDPSQVVKERTGSSPPPDFDPFYPATRLAEFCEAQDLTCINLASLFKEYKEDHNLKFPYFSYADDDHWDMLGHKVAADIVYSFLECRYLNPEKPNNCSPQK